MPGISLWLWPEPGGVACDVEEVAARADSVWDGLLGRDRCRMAERISRERPEDLNTAATRLWNALECMKKAGLSPEAPLVLDSTTNDGWVLFRSGALTIATCVVAVQGTEAPLAIGLALNQVVEGAASVACRPSGCDRTGVSHALLRIPASGRLPGNEPGR